MRRKRSMSIEGFFRMRLKLPGSQCTLRASHASLRSCSFSFAFIALPMWYSSDSILCFPCVSVAKLQLTDCFAAIYHCIVYNVSLRYLQCFLPTMKKRRFPLYSFRGLPHPCPNTISACAKRKHQLVFCEAIESGSFGNSRIKANAYSVCQNDCLSVSFFYTLLIIESCLFGKDKVLLSMKVKKVAFPIPQIKNFSIFAARFLKNVRKQHVIQLKNVRKQYIQH